MLTVPRILVASLFLTLLAPAPAAAGGWWASVHTNRSTVAAGQRVKVRTEVMFNSIEAAERGRDEGRFYVYALRGVDDAMVVRAMNKPFRPGWWSLGDAEAVELGRVALSVTNGNLAWARASFVVPDDLPPTTYDLMLCDAGCAHALADVIPTSGFTVAADRATAAVAARTDRLENRLRNLGERLRRERRSANRVQTTAEHERQVLEERVRLLSLVVGKDPAPSSPPSPNPSLWTYVGCLLGGAFLGALASVLLLRGRRPAPARAAGERWQPTDEELRQLLASERSRL